MANAEEKGKQSETTVKELKASSKAAEKEVQIQTQIAAKAKGRLQKKAEKLKEIKVSLLCLHMLSIFLTEILHCVCLTFRMI